MNITSSAFANEEVMGANSRARASSRQPSAAPTSNNVLKGRDRRQTVGQWSQEGPQPLHEQEPGDVTVSSKSVVLKSITKPSAKPPPDQRERYNGEGREKRDSRDKRFSTMFSRRDVELRAKDIFANADAESLMDGDEWKRTEAHGASYPVSKLNSFLGQSWSKSGVLDPSSSFMVRWDFLTTLCLLFTIFVTPYEVSFLETKLNELFWINRVVDFVFIVDIFITMHLTYVDPTNGKWVTSLKRIRERYIRSTFTLDVISVLPFDIIGVAADSKQLNDLKILRVVKLFKLAKLMRIIRAGRLLRQIENSYPINYGVMQLVGFLISVLIAGHWLACMFRMTVTLTTDDVTQDENWILRMTQQGELPENSTAYDHYVVAYYWAIMTMTTIGYGDVPITSTSERTAAIVGMMLGTAFYTYIIGAVTGIVTTLNMSHREFYQRCDGVNRFCQAYKLPNTMRHKLREYFRYKHSKTGLYDYHGLLEEMSPGLQREVAIITQMHWVKSLRFFKDCDHAFLTDVVMVMNHVHFPQGEVFIEPGDPPTHMYVIVSGIAMHEGRMFCSWGLIGEDMVHSSRKREGKARALTFVNAFELTKDNLEVCFERHPTDAKRVRKRAAYAGIRVEFLAFAKAKRLFDDARAHGAVDVVAYVMRSHYNRDGSTMWTASEGKKPITNRELHHLSRLADDDNRMIAALKIQRKVKKWRKQTRARLENEKDVEKIYQFPAWVTRTAQMLSKFDGKDHVDGLFRRHANLTHQIALHQNSFAQKLNHRLNAVSELQESHEKLRKALSLLLRQSGVDPSTVWQEEEGVSKSSA